MFKFKTWCGIAETHVVTFDIDCHFIHYNSSAFFDKNVYYIFSKENPSKCGINEILCKINGEYLWALYKGEIIEYDEKSVETTLSEYLDCSKLYFAEYLRGKLVRIYKVYKIKCNLVYFIKINFPTEDNFNLCIDNDIYSFKDLFKWNKLECDPSFKYVFERRIKEICNLCLQK